MNNPFNLWMGRVTGTLWCLLFDALSFAKPMSFWLTRRGAGPGIPYYGFPYGFPDLSELPPAGTMFSLGVLARKLARRSFV
jgi:hypothetical protein